MQAISFSEARVHLAQTLHQVEQSHRPLFISRCGKTTAVLMSIETYYQITGTQADFSERLAVWRQTHQAELEDGTDDFQPTRAIESGCDFVW